MYKSTVRAVIAAAAVVALGFGAAGTAAAAPGDVTLSATTTGNTVTTTITNNSDKSISCQWFIFDDPFDPSINYQNSDFLHYSVVSDLPAGEFQVQTATDLPVGEEVFIEWACFAGLDADPDSIEAWGTPIIDRAEVIGGPHVPTAQTLNLVVGVPVVVPEPPVETCTGSVCLPTGSFGF